jgi:hypothetical protein
MNAKFKSINHLMSEIDEEISERNADIEWYKFKVKQISARMPKPI